MSGKPHSEKSPNKMMGYLSTRLVFTFILLVIITAVAAGVPAVWIFLSEMEAQAWARVSDAKNVTNALLEAKRLQVNDLAVFTSERPTLQRLLRANDLEGLGEYLESFHNGIELDVLTISDANGNVLGLAGSPLSGIELPLSEFPNYFESVSDISSLALLASQPIYNNQGGEILGYATVGILLDDEFTQLMQQQTGFEHSVIISQEYIASSLEEGFETLAVQSEDSEKKGIGFFNYQYYSGKISILNEVGESIALVEVALPVSQLVSAQQRGIIALVISTGLIAMVGSVVGVVYARKLTSPLKKLTSAAQNIIKGDFSTPIEIPDAPHEIIILSEAFEESRESTFLYLEQLSQAKAWSETLIQSMTEGIITIDQEGKITSFSQGAERITNWKGQAVIGHNLNRVLQLQDRSKKITEHLPPDGGKCQLEILTRDEKPVTLAITSVQVTHPGSDDPEYALVLRDVTEENAIQNLRAYFLANITHEFRTPLAAIKASMELLLAELDHMSLSEISELLNSIHFSLSGLQTLIDNLLESMSIEAGRFKIRRRPTMVRDVFVDAVRVMKPLLDRRHQALIFNDPEQLQPIIVDPTRLTQVLVNLLSNASKYSPIGEDIEVSMELNGSHELKGAVLDRGPGISEVDRENLFKRFVRLEAQSEAQYGIGLGLSVVKTIIEEHGGEMGVSAREGKGSNFWFKIPIDQEKK